LWKALAGVAALGLAAPALAVDEPRSYGTWAITEAKVAPWADPKEDAFSAAEQHRLIGTRVIFGPTRIVGPSPLRCDDPHYTILEYPADELFQGGLTDAAAQAQALGFHEKMTPTLDTGCAEIEFHLADPTTAMFALNNMIYVMRKRLETP
jgi:hypothetical protein